MDSIFKEQVTTDSDLAAINRLTLRPLSESEVFTFGLDIMEAERPTSNGRVWSKEWLQKNAPRFVGTPVTVGHVEPSDLDRKVATMYEATFDGTWLRARAFVPVTDERGKAARESLENGTYSAVSIEGIGAVQKQGDHIRIVPSENDRALAVALTLKPGLETAKVTESVSPQTGETPARDDLLTTFAAEAINDLRNDFIRAAGFAVSSADRTLLRKVAEQLDPFVLRDLTRAIDKSYTTRQQESATEARTASEQVSSAVDEALKRIRQTKGMD